MAKSNLIKDFKTFIERGSAIDMAVGIIVGGVMTSVVNSLVKDVLMPPIGLLIGGIDFSDWTIVLKQATESSEAVTMNIGLFLNTIVSFLITMFAVFWIVKIVGKARSKKPVTTRACPYCKSSINIAAVKCPNCCSDVEPVEATAVEDSDLQKKFKELSKAATGQISKIKKITKR